MIQQQFNIFRGRRRRPYGRRRRPLLLPVLPDALSYCLREAGRRTVVHGRAPNRTVVRFRANQCTGWCTASAPTS